MEVAHPLVSVTELTRSLLPINMLPEELSEVLGVSLSEVLARYYSGLDISERGHLIGDTLDRKQLEEEGEEWLAEEARKRDIVAELVHRGGDDTY
jgi:hypothetical protein